ncbi:MAG: META domain-containing protein [Chitinophagales bacterium]
MKRVTLFVFICCFANTFASVYLKVVYVADHAIGCGANKCLLVRDSPADSFSVFKNEIQGFTYEEGFEYCILMEIQTPGISEPAITSDSSQIKYVLSEIKSKTKTKIVVDTKKGTFNIPDSSKWMLYKLRMKEETKTFSIQKAYLQFDLKNNTVTGNTECNSLKAGFTADEAQLKFDNIITTKIACNKRSIEPTFLNMLSTSTNYKIVKNLLYIYKGKYLMALFTKKK